MTAEAKARVIVAEDEALSREALVGMFAALPSWEVVFAASNGKTALSACLDASPDLVVTDVRMPILGGLELAAAVRDASPRTQIVFVTAHDAHAVEAFRLAAVDYLLKPITDAAFRECLARVERSLLAARALQTLEIDGFLQAKRSEHRHLVVRSLGQVDIVPLEDVVALRACGNYVEVLARGATYMHRETLKSLAERLDPARFVQIHRSTIVALARVRGVARDPTGANVRMDGGASFPASPRFLRALEQALGI